MEVDSLSIYPMAPGATETCQTVSWRNRSSSGPVRGCDAFKQCVSNSVQMSHEKNLGWLGYTGDYTAQLYGDYNKPLERSGFFVAQTFSVA